MSQEGNPAVPAAPAAPAAPIPAPAPAPAAAAEPPAPAAAPAGDPPKWALERIDRLTADKRDLERKLAEQSPPASAAAPAPVPPIAAAAPAPVAPVFNAAAIEAKASEIADRRIAQQAFAGKIGAIAQEGLKTHPADWAATVGNLERINAIDADVINIVSELGNSHEIIYALGKDMNEAARIASLPPGQKGIALARFSDKLAEEAKKKVSGAPAPIPEVGGGSTPASGLSDKDSMDEWARKRKAGKLARAAGGNRPAA